MMTVFVFMFGGLIDTLQSDSHITTRLNRKEKTRQWNTERKDAVNLGEQNTGPEQN